MYHVEYITLIKNVLRALGKHLLFITFSQNKDVYKTKFLNVKHSETDKTKQKVKKALGFPLLEIPGGVIS